MKTNEYMDVILHKMCEFAGVNFETTNFNDNSYLEIPYSKKGNYVKFIKWLSDYLYSLKISELKHIAKYPYILHKRKKKCMDFAKNFESYHGFKLHPEDNYL